MDIIDTITTETDVAALAAPTVHPDTSAKPKFTSKDVMDKAEEIASRRDDAWPSIAALTILYVLRGARREAVTKHLEAKGFKWARQATIAGENFLLGVMNDADKATILTKPLVAAMDQAMVYMRKHRDDCGATNWSPQWYSIAGTHNIDEAKASLTEKARKSAEDKALKKAAKEAAEKSELPDLNAVQVDPIEAIMLIFASLNDEDKYKVVLKTQEYYVGQARVVNPDTEVKADVEDATIIEEMKEAA